MKKQLYLVWAELRWREPSLLHVRPVSKGPVELPKYGRVLRASSPKRAVRRFVRNCLPMFLHLEEDGSHEPQDITHAKSSAQNHERRVFKRQIRREFLTDLHQPKFQLHAR